jgi:hypothetical protein
MVLLVAGGAALAACPPATQRDGRLAAARAAGDIAALDAAWQAAVDDARACRDVAREAQSLSEWSDQARRLGATDRVLQAEQARVQLAEDNGLLAHEADARLKIGMLAVARGGQAHAPTQ